MQDVRRGVCKTSKVNSNSLGGRIQDLRIKKNLTRSELGELLGYKTEKSARNNVGEIENGVKTPTEEKLNKFAEVLGVSATYLLTGKEEVTRPEVKPASERPDPQPLKTALSNHEGYMDPTAAKAVAIVMSTKKPAPSVGNKVLPKYNPKPGEVYEVLNCSTPLLVLSVTGENVLMTNLLVRKYEGAYIKEIIVSDKLWYINLSKVFTRKTIDLIDMVGLADSKDLNYVLGQYSKNFGFGTIEVTKPEKAEPDPDPISIRFTDSMNYFNAKNGTSFEVPYGVLTLQMAVDISEQMNIPLNDLIKDHTEDRVMDEIIKLQERIKELEASIGLNN